MVAQHGNLIGSKQGVTPCSARRSRTSPIRGMRLQRLLGTPLAREYLLDWQSSVAFRPCVFAVGSLPTDPGLDSSARVTRQTARHAPIRTFVRLLPTKVGLSLLGITRYREIRDRKGRNIITCDCVSPNHTATMRVRETRQPPRAAQVIGYTGYPHNGISL